jgi:hypothetical protein
MNEVCIANIGPRQRRVRLLIGLAGLAVAAVIVAASLLSGHVPGRWGALPFVFAGLVSVLQHREKT